MNTTPEQLSPNPTRMVKMGDSIVNPHVSSCDLEFFWLRVDKSSDDESCWLWTGAKSEAGYGDAKVGSSRILAHRLSAFIAFGPYHITKLVCHKCDNPSCVNPRHLFFGTDLENIRDAKKKGRLKPMPKCPPEKRLRGENHQCSKLTNAQRKEIVELRIQGFSLSKLSKRFGVSGPQIVKIFRKFRHLAV